MKRFILLAMMCVGLSGATVWAGNEAVADGEPVLERPTIHSLGAYWIIRGDDNRNATVAVQFRKKGQGKWEEGYPLFRVEKDAAKHKENKTGSKLQVPEGAWLFAGSVVMLDEDTAYEIKLSLKDSDGGVAESVLEARTKAEPKAPKDMTTRHVVPGEGGGKGTKDDPFKGLAAAEAAAKPGDLFLVHAGKYPGTFSVKHGGTDAKPIIWRGAGDGEALIEGQGREQTHRGIEATGIANVWFEDLAVRNVEYAMVAHDSGRIVLRRCHFYDVIYGLVAVRNTNEVLLDYFVSDNLMEGPSTWPRTKGIEEARGVQISGAGHDVCYNRIRGFADAIDTLPSLRCEAIDFYNNDVSELTDDGFEMDYSQRNTRCFNNRLTNVFQGISEQPIFGGPVYIFRNVMYNVGLEPFKMHNSPSGALIFHNTVVKKEGPWMVYTSEAIHNCVYRNNLFVGTPGRYAFECSPPAIDCDFDYDGFGGGPFDNLVKWNGQVYKTLDDVKKSAPIYKHMVLVDAAKAFASGVKPPESIEKQYSPTGQDLRLSSKSEAVDAGAPLANFTAGFAGKAPDLGAYEAGAALPHYGPRRAGSGG